MRTISADLPSTEHYSRNLLSVALSVSTIILMVVCIGTYKQPRVFQNSFFISILDGEFIVPGDRSGGGKNLNNLTVRADKLVTLNFTSDDFVYTVLQPEQNAAKVVLPGKSALMSLQLPAGIWEFRIAAGCGVRSPNHKQMFHIQAVDQL